MSAVRTMRVKSRLSRLIGKPGGITVREAIQRSEAAVEEFRESGVTAIDAILAEIDLLFASTSDKPSVEERERLYFLSTQIIDVAICLPDSDIDKAAYAFCDLIDLCANLNAWDRQCVEIHISVLRLLRHTGPQLSATKRDRMIEGLGKITVRRFGDFS